jgi:hypothetical protein
MVVAPPLTRVGEACMADPDCGPGLKCYKSLGKGGSTLPLPGGYCSKTCDANHPCPTGSECVSTLYGPFCMNKCPTNGCRTGYACCTSVNACGVASLCGGPGGGGEGG